MQFYKCTQAGLVFCAILMMGCATPSLKEIQTKTDSKFIDKSECVSKFSELDLNNFLQLEYDFRTTVKVDEKSKCLILNNEPTYIATYALPEFDDKGYGIQIDSKIIKQQLVFVPNLYLLDKDLQVVSILDAEDFKYRQIKFEKTVFVNTDDLQARYAVFATDSNTVGDSEMRRLSLSESTYLGNGGYIVTGNDSQKEIFYTTQGEISVTTIKN